MRQSGRQGEHSPSARERHSQLLFQWPRHVRSPRHSATRQRLCRSGVLDDALHLGRLTAPCTTAPTRPLSRPSLLLPSGPLSSGRLPLQLGCFANRVELPLQRRALLLPLADRVLSGDESSLPLVQQVRTGDQQLSTAGEKKTESMAFLSTAGMLRLYSGVTIR